MENSKRVHSISHFSPPRYLLVHTHFIHSFIHSIANTLKLHTLSEFSVDFQKPAFHFCLASVRTGKQEKGRGFRSAAALPLHTLSLNINANVYYYYYYIICCTVLQFLYSIIWLYVYIYFFSSFLLLLLHLIYSSI